MSILKKAAVLSVAACASAVGFAAPASAQANVYVQVVVVPPAAPVIVAPQVYYVAPPISVTHVLYNRPPTIVTEVQPYYVYAPQHNYYQVNVEPRKQSRWR